MSCVSRSTSSNSLVNEVVLRALQYEDDDAEHGSSIESEDDHTVMFAPTPPEVTPETPATKKITTQDYVLYGIFTLEEVESPRFPPTPIGYGDSSPVYRPPQPIELTFRNELHKVYTDLSTHMDRHDIELLGYSSHNRRLLASLIELLRLNMNSSDTAFYQNYYQVVQKRFRKPIFKDYFPKD